MRLIEKEFISFMERFDDTKRQPFQKSSIKRTRKKFNYSFIGKTSFKSESRPLAMK